MHKNKWILVTVCIVLIALVIAGARLYPEHIDNKQKAYSQTNSENGETAGEVDSEAMISKNPPDETNMTQYEFKDATETVSEMIVGWNLGNTLDSCDYKKYSPLKSDYQIMAVYANEQWSGWDASNAFYFGSDGLIELNWQIDSLNSKQDGRCGTFSFQLINNVIKNTGNLPVKLEVIDAHFTKQDGMVIELDDMEGSYELPIEKNVSKYVVSNLKDKIGLNTAEDILGGVLSLNVKITEYPNPDNIDEEAKKIAYYETLWGNPITTKKMIDKVAEAGFNAIRIPVTYYDHINEYGKIDEAWLARIKQIVDYVIEDNLYCIINTHHDSGKLFVADMNTIDLQKENVKNVWGQIASYFKDYDEKLLFESFNEILNTNAEWKDAGQPSYEAVNILNQQFVDTIRGTGGNNLYRNLILNTYANSGAQDVLEAFVLPNDIVRNHLIVEIHYYSALKDEPEKQDRIFSALNKNMIEKDIPVIIGEFASVINWNKEDSIAYIENFMQRAQSNNIVVFWWDMGGKRDVTKNLTEPLLNRENLTWYSPDKLVAVLSEKE